MSCTCMFQNRFLKTVTTKFTASNGTPGRAHAARAPGLRAARLFNESNSAGGGGRVARGDWVAWLSGHNIVNVSLKYYYNNIDTVSCGGRVPLA